MTQVPDHFHAVRQALHGYIAPLDEPNPWDALRNLEEQLEAALEQRDAFTYKSVDIERLQEQYETLLLAARGLLESADDQDHPDDGFPIEAWLDLVEAVRGSNPASEPRLPPCLPHGVADCPTCIADAERIVDSFQERKP